MPKNKKQELLELRAKRKKEAREARNKIKLELLNLRKKTKILNEKEKKTKILLRTEQRKEKSNARKNALEDKKILTEKVSELNDQKSLIRQEKNVLREKLRVDKQKQRANIIEFNKLKREKLLQIRIEQQDFKRKNILEKKKLIAELKQNRINLEKKLSEKRNINEKNRLKKLDAINKEKIKLKDSKLKINEIKQKQLNKIRIKKSKKIEEMKKEKEALRIAKENIKANTSIDSFKNEIVNSQEKTKSIKEVQKYKDEVSSIKEISLKQDFEKESINELKSDIRNINLNNKIDMDASTQSVDTFKNAFEDEHVDKNIDLIVPSSIVVNSYGKIGEKLYKEAQKPATDKILSKLKNKPSIIETIEKYRESVKNEKPSQFIKLAPFAEEIDDLDEEFMNKFYAHAITTILVGRSIKFGDGYINKQKQGNITTYNYSKLPIDKHPIEYLDANLGEKLNILITQKLKNGAKIEITKGLLVNCLDEEIEILFDTNVMI